MGLSQARTLGVAFKVVGVVLGILVLIFILAPVDVRCHNRNQLFHLSADELYCFHEAIGNRSYDLDPNRLRDADGKCYFSQIQLTLPLIWTAIYLWASLIGVIGLMYKETGFNWRDIAGTFVELAMWIASTSVILWTYRTVWPQRTKIVGICDSPDTWLAAAFFSGLLCANCVTEFVISCFYRNHPDLRLS